MTQFPWVCVCGHEPCDGLDCGVLLKAPRRRLRKTRAELAEIRAKAWTTRRALGGGNET